MFTYAIQITLNEFSTQKCGGNLQILLQFCTYWTVWNFYYSVKGAMALFHDKILTEKENIECLPM